MKHAALALALIITASPVYAQFPRVPKVVDDAAKLKAKTDKLSDIVFTDAEERQLGEHVSGLLLDRFGVYQDAAVTKYVTLLGSVLAQASSRPALKWEFIVLDTDGVNAYAAPGGLIHITRGALGLIKTEAELAGVLGHELAHVTEKHTIRAIQKANATQLGIDVGAARAPGGALTQSFVTSVGNQIYSDLFENKFDRGDEMGSDKVGIQLANKVGYAPTGMIDFLNKVAARNQGMNEPNGMFASHPQIKDRISEMEKEIKRRKLAATATVAARYGSTITFDAKPASAIAMDIPGVKGAVGDTAKAEPAKEEKKTPRRIGPINLTPGASKKDTQTVASAGSRGGVPDRDAVGGPNKSKLRITVTSADIEAFRKQIGA